MKNRPAVFQNENVELAIGIGTFILAAYIIYDVYEGRGRKRPFLTKFLPIP